MKNYSELLKDMIKRAGDLKFEVKRSPRFIEFHKNGILIDRVIISRTDYTISDSEYNRKLKIFER